MKKLSIVVALVVLTTAGAQADFVGIGNPAATSLLDSKPAWDGSFRGYSLLGTGSKLSGFDAAIHAVSLTDQTDLTSLDGITLTLKVTDGAGKLLDSLDFTSPSFQPVDSTTMLLHLNSADLAFKNLPDLSGRQVGVFLGLTSPDTAMWINQSDISDKLSSRLVNNQILDSNLGLAMNISFSTIPEPNIAPISLAVFGAGFLVTRYRVKRAS